MINPIDNEFSRKFQQHGLEDTAAYKRKLVGKIAVRDGLKNRIKTIHNGNAFMQESLSSRLEEAELWVRIYTKAYNDSFEFNKYIDDLIEGRI